MKRPSSNGSTTTTPRAGVMLNLLGGVTAGPIALTGDEFRAIKKLYGFKPEKPHKKPPPPEPPKEKDFSKPWEYREALQKHELALEAHARWESPQPMMQAGADRNAIRHAEQDGLRLLAWLAKFITAGEDPLKSLVQLACDAGWDVDGDDIAWSETEEEAESA